MIKQFGTSIAAVAAAASVSISLAPGATAAKGHPVAHHKAAARTCTKTVARRRVRRGRVFTVHVKVSCRTKSHARVLRGHVAASRHRHWTPPPPPVTTTTTTTQAPSTTTSSATTTVSSPSSPSTSTSSTTTTSSSSTTTSASSGLSAAAVDAYDVQVNWPSVAGVASVQLYVDGKLLDQFDASSGGSYTVRELWPQTSYTFEVKALSSAGASVGDFTGTATTSPASGSFPRLYANSAFINTPVPATASLDPNSANMVSSALASYQGSANFSNSDAWGIPIVSGDTQSPLYSIGCQYYWCTTNFAPVHIPAMAQPNTGSDGHLAILQPDGSEMDAWIAQHTSAGWTSGERWLTSATGPAVNCGTYEGCGGADVAGFALAAGIIRPEEIAQGHIDHALIITTPMTRQGYTACPANNSDGKHTSPNALPIGAHVQLDPNVNVASLAIPAWEKVIATALQRYGAYVGDTGGSLAVEAESNLGRAYDAWSKAGISSSSPSLNNLPWSSMRVLSMTQCG